MYNTLAVRSYALVQQQEPPTKPSCSRRKYDCLLRNCSRSVGSVSAFLWWCHLEGELADAATRHPSSHFSLSHIQRECIAIFFLFKYDIILAIIIQLPLFGCHLGFYRYGVLVLESTDVVSPELGSWRVFDYETRVRIEVSCQHTRSEVSWTSIQCMNVCTNPWHYKYRYRTVGQELQESCPHDAGVSTASIQVQVNGKSGYKYCIGTVSWARQ